MDTIKKIYVFLILVTVVVILIFAQNVIIPFILAILIWFMIRIIKKVLTRTPLLKKMPDWSKTIVSSVILLSLLFLVVSMITINIRYLSVTLPEYEENITKVTQRLHAKFGLEFPIIWTDLTSDINFGTILAESSPPSPEYSAVP